MFSVFWKRGFRVSRDEEFTQRSWRGDTEKIVPRGGSVYYWFGKHRRECKTSAPEPAREDAEQKSGGSQRGHPTEREISYSVYNW